MRVWITNEPWPATETVIAAAETVGADAIWHGIPESHADVIPAGTTGAVDIEEPTAPAYPPLDAVGVLATLLVIEGVLTLQDASNALHEEPGHIEHEALAWQAASTL